MLVTKLKIATAGLLLAALVSYGVGVRSLTASAAGQAEPKGRKERQPKGKATAEDLPTTLKLNAPVQFVEWSSNGKLLVTRSYRWEKDPTGKREDGDAYSTIQFWDTRTGTLKLSLGEVKNSGMFAVAFSPDGTTLAISYRLAIAQGDKVEFWDVATGGLKRTIEMDYGRGAPALTFSPDGKTFAVAHTGEKQGVGLVGGALLFDTRTGERKHSLLGHKGLGNTAAFAPNSKVLATGGEDGTIRLWDVESGTLSQALERGETGRMFSLAFAPDGKQLLSAGADGRVLLWDLGKRKAKPLEQPSSRTLNVLFSRNGKWIAAGGVAANGGQPMGEVRLFDAHTGQLERTWSNAIPSAVSFAPDSRTLAIGHTSKTVRLWRVKE